MRVARFQTDRGDTCWGRLTDDHTAVPFRGDPTRGAARGAEPEPVNVRRLLAPADPPNIFAIGRNYGAHAAETGAKLPDAPLVFMIPTSAVIGPGDPIHLPESAPDEVDFEAELAIVIGREARRVAPEAATGHIYGYTCANDVTARDCQRSDRQWARAKGFDTFCPVGPWIVTADAFDPSGRAVRSRLNGRVMQDGNTADMVHDCARLVSYLSHQFTLRAGTLILTGTPEGVGFVREPPVFLRSGDRIEIEIDGIGTLSNPVA